MAMDDLRDRYPEKTCDINRLIRHPKLIAAAKEGRKTQQRRNGVYAYPGETFDLDGIPFKMTELKRRNLAEMTDADAAAEGYSSLDDYRNMIIAMHPGMTWNADAPVWVHCFERV